MDDLYLKVDEYKMVEIPKEIPTIEPLPLNGDIYNDAWTLSTSGSISIDASNTPFYHLLAMSGLKKYIPNNWLKHHGYPMKRR